MGPSDGAAMRVGKQTTVANTVYNWDSTRQKMSCQRIFWRRIRSFPRNGLDMYSMMFDTLR